MDYVAQGETIGCANRVLRFFTIFDVIVGNQTVQNVLRDAEVVEFAVFDEDGNQTFPGAGFETVDTTQDCPAGGHIALGEYIATWTVDAAEPIGPHTVRWRYKSLAADTTFLTVTRKFEVIAEKSNAIGPTYGSIAEMRLDGIDECDADDLRLHKIIVRVSRSIERFTGRHFDPRGLNMFLDGSGGRRMMFDQPVISVGEVALDAALLSAGELLIEPDLFFVYNRHITQGIVHPDDRNNPKVEFFHGRDLFGRSEGGDGLAGISFNRLMFTKGPQNVRIQGVFGYTDPDGGTLGETPELIDRAAALMVLRELPRLVDIDKREDATRRWRLLSEKTRDQEYKLADLSRAAGAIHQAVGFMTGDPLIDNILAQYMRPPAVATA